MNAEQLNSARLARWSQNGEARLTLEAAVEWLNTIGFCPYIPNPSGTTPTPSFLEAVVGRPAQVPSAGERSRANDLLVRVIENSAAVPLNLGPLLAEQPDCIASAEAFRYIYALRGNRNFKAGPSTVGNEKVTPLTLHCWQAIQEHGPLDVAALQPILGRDMTRTAILRALHELWSGMHAFPILSANRQAPQWELLSRRFPQQVAAGASTGQAEAQSALVSLYLHAVVAATEEEILAVLSPFAPQSKLREVIRGLGSLRQLDMIDIGGRAHLCLQGGLLPEMVMQLSEESLAPPATEPELLQRTSEVGGSLSTSGEITIEIEREPEGAPRTWVSEASGAKGKFVPKKFVPRKFIPKRSGTAESAGKRFGLQAAGGDASSFKGRDFPGDRSGGPGSSSSRFTPRAPEAPRGQGARERGERWKKPGERSGFKPGGFKLAKPWSSKQADGGSEGARPWMKRAVPTPNAPQVDGFQQKGRPGRWSKPREGVVPFHSGSRKPYVAKSSGFRSEGFKAGGLKPAGLKSGGTKPWAARRSSGSDADVSGARAYEKRPGRWEKSGAGARGMEERTDGRSAAQSGTRPAERRPWKNRPDGANTGESRSGENKAPRSKPWVSKGAASRVGSAKSYAARSPRGLDRDAPRVTGKPYAKAGGAKPWAKRPVSANAASQAGDENRKPPRREKPQDASASKPGGKRDAKPFWSKNPRGGKGSVPASRSNRPHVKSGGRKKGGKRK